MLLTPAVEPHIHLDKVFLAESVVNTTGDLRGAIDAMAAARGHLGVDETIERAARGVARMMVNGYRAARTHVDVTVDHGLRSVEALVDVRRQYGNDFALQIVALCGNPVLGPAGAEQRALMGAALDLGADVVGGCPHLEPDDGSGEASRRATDWLLELAAERGVPIDLHTDETLDPAADGLSELADLVVATGFAAPVTASHCVSLGVRPEADQRRIAEAVAAAGIGVVALPCTNLFLQGRDHQQAMPRGVTAVKALREAGVVVAAGADNVQDPFNPLGRLDPFETAGLLILTTHVLPDVAWAMVSTDAAAVIRHRLDPDDALDVDAGSLREAIAEQPARRLSVRRGP